MQQVSEIQISLFSNMKAKQGSTISLFAELGNIKRGTYKKLILECRKAFFEGDKETYGNLKSQLPAVTFSGIFNSGRRANIISHYNNLIVIDIDNISNVENIFELLKTDKHIIALWKSPSGAGLKGLIRTERNVEFHGAVFNALRFYFLNMYEVELDRSGSDVSRLCFSSWDEKLFYSHKPQVFNEILEIEKENKLTTDQAAKLDRTLNSNAYATEGYNKKSDSKVVRNIIKFLNKNDISITDSYDSWVKIALAISCTFSYDVGERFFLQICALDKEKHFENQCVNLLKYCYNKRQFTSNNIISIGTIVFFAKKKGFIVNR